MSETSGANTKAPYIFVCYAHDDAALVFPHVEWLQAHGVECWYDDRDIRAGTVWKEQIGQALERATHLLFFASRASIASDHCDRELSFAIDNTKHVIPIFLEDVTLTPGLRVSLSRVQALVAHRLPADDVRANLLAAITGDGDAVAGTTRRTASTGKRMHWGIGGVVALAAVIVAIAWWRGFVPGGSSTPPIADASVAVLPFVAMSDDPAMRHLGEVFAEEITNQLAGRPDLKVASRTSAFQATGDVGSIGRSLGVAFVVEGSVRPVGDGIRLTTQLVRAGDGLHAWSATYYLPAGTTPSEQQDTLRTVAVTVDWHLAEELNLQRFRTETRSESAYAHFAKAYRLRFQLMVGGTSLPVPMVQVLEDVDAALAIDPDFVPALNLRANMYMNRVDDTVRWDVALREARKSIDRALRLAPNDPDSLNQLATIQMYLELDPGGAQQTLERVRQITPNGGKLTERLALLAMIRGLPHEAMRYWQQHLDVGPYDALGHAQYGNVLLVHGDLDGAEREFNAALRLSPNGGQQAITATLGLVQVLVLRGDVAKANAVFAPLWAQFQHARPALVAFLAYPLALLGREAEARALIAEASHDPDVDPSLCVLTYWALKEYDDALVWLRRGIDDRDSFILLSIRMPKIFPGLRELPGYADALAYLDSLQRSR